MCRTSTKVDNIYQSGSSNNADAFLGAVITDPKEDTWEATVKINDTPAKFQIDSGAEVTAISKTLHKTIGSPPLSSPGKVLKGPSILGKFTATLKRSDKKTDQSLYVVKNLHRPLLGRPAIEDLELFS